MVPGSARSRRSPRSARSSRSPRSDRSSRAARAKCRLRCLAIPGRSCRRRPAGSWETPPGRTTSPARSARLRRARAGRRHRRARRRLRRARAGRGGPWAGAGRSSPVPCAAATDLARFARSHAHAAQVRSSSRVLRDRASGSLASASAKRHHLAHRGVARSRHGRVAQERRDMRRSWLGQLVLDLDGRRTGRRHDDRDAGRDPGGRCRRQRHLDLGGQSHERVPQPDGNDDRRRPASSDSSPHAQAPR